MTVLFLTGLFWPQVKVFLAKYQSENAGIEAQRQLSLLWPRRKLI